MADMVLNSMLKVITEFVRIAICRENMGRRSFDKIFLGISAEFVAEGNPLFHIWDFDDTALCLRVLWILHHRHVQFFLAFAESDVCCAITRGDLKYVEKLALRR